MSMKPHKTSVTYGRSYTDKSDEDKTDSQRDSFTVKQDFIWEQIMNGLKISFAVVAFVLVQGIGVIWYVSKLDSRVDQMYKSFEEENKKEVIENQVKMKIDLENLIADVKELQREMKQMNKKDKEIVKQNKSIEKQHKDLFQMLQGANDMIQQNQTKGGYSYGD